MLNVTYKNTRKKALPWIWTKIEKYVKDFNSVLDVFGKSAYASYFFKKQGKLVVFNDIYLHNYHAGNALIENSSFTLQDYEQLLIKKPNKNYKFYLSEIFENRYFSKSDLEWLDITIQNIHDLPKFTQSIAYLAVLQTCIKKRPFGSFHRPLIPDEFRSNDITFNKFKRISFSELFKQLVEHINSKIFTNSKPNLALNKNEFELPTNVDLVFIDPILIRATKNNRSVKDIETRYHFLEGLVNYDKIPFNIDAENYRGYYKMPNNPWITTNENKLRTLYHDLVDKFRKNVISLVLDGDTFVGWFELVNIAKKFNKKVQVFKLENGTFRSDLFLLILT